MATAAQTLTATKVYRKPHLSLQSLSMNLITHICILCQNRESGLRFIMSKMARGSTCNPTAKVTRLFVALSSSDIFVTAAIGTQT